MINFQNVTKIFKSDLLAQPFTALKNVDFQIPAGSMVGFLGANGAGKTTSLKIIMDFIRPTSGEVVFDTYLGHSRMEILRNIGFLPERPYFYPNLTGREFLHFMGFISELSRAQINSEIKKWSPRFKIDHALDRELKTYSKGMLQRIGFLATILHQPKLIILDEPLSGLDPIGRKELKDVIIDVHREGKTVFFSSHIVPDIEEICDRVIFLKEGLLAYDGPVRSLLSKNDEQDFIFTVQNLNLQNLKTSAMNIVELPDGIKKFKVNVKDKESMISDIMASDAKIIGLEMIKPSLEEIFYHTQSNS